MLWKGRGEEGQRGRVEWGGEEKEDMDGGLMGERGRGVVLSDGRGEEEEGGWNTAESGEGGQGVWWERGEGRG